MAHKVIVTIEIEIDGQTALILTKAEAEQLYQDLRVALNKKADTPTSTDKPKKPPIPPYGNLPKERW